MYGAPFRTSSCLPPTSTRIGVLNPSSFGRSAFQSVFPLILSRPNRNGSESLSPLSTRMLPTRMALAAVPRPSFVVNSPRSCRDQTCLPSTVKQYAPGRPNHAQTCFPSVTQLGVAQLFILWIFSGFPFQTECSHSTLPELASTQKTTRSRPSSSAVVRKIRSPQSTGDDWPRPFSSVFQTTLEASHFMGTVVPGGTRPVPSGPRMRGQLPPAGSAATALEETRRKAKQ